LNKAEVAADLDDRRALALRAYDEAEQVRVVRDAIFGDGGKLDAEP
jgi:hypothetical protein